MDNKDIRIGKVKFFNDKKGYGFVIDNETGKEYFFHYSVIDTKFDFKKIFKDWVVRFIVGTTEDGKEACTWVCSAKDLVHGREQKNESDNK
jgi:CspA family cold shock protein